MREAMQRLVLLGIDGIEHGALMDDDTVRMMEETAPTWYRPSVPGDATSCKTTLRCWTAPSS